MHFTLSEEQRLMQDSLVRLLQRSYSFEQRQAYQRAAPGWSGEVWTQYAEMGLLALPFDEAYGGLSGTPVETMIVMEQLGRAITLEPYLATVVLAGGLIRLAGDEAQKESLIGRIADGSSIVTLAHDEADASNDIAHVTTTARRVNDGWRLDGQKSFALQAGSADLLLVSARVIGGPADKSGLGVFIVDPKTPGVKIEDYATHDGQRAGSITLSGATVASDQTLGTPGEAYPALVRVHEEAIAATCAEAVGAMAELHQITVDYLKQRKQFGVAIGSFQVLQHRAVDMFMALEQARSMVMYATIMSSNPDGDARAQATSAAKVQIGRSGQIVGELAVQLHGGIAVAMEFKAGHYFKKLTVLNRLFGDADHHLELLSQGGSLFDRD